jgi:alcohol dehydrogenase
METLTDLHFNVPAQVVFGPDCLMRISGLLARPDQRVLIVTEAILYEKKIINKLQELLDDRGINFITFDEVFPNATSTTVEDGIKLAKASRASAVIGLGGVRTLSIAKCIAMAARGNRSIDDYLTGARPDAEPLDYVEVPTTCRNQFAFTDDCSIVDARDRSGRIISTQPMITKLVVVDPNLSLALPDKYTITTMLDTLVSAVEGYISTRSNFISDILFERAIETMYASIVSGDRANDDPLFREACTKAGLLTGLGLSAAKPGIAIGLSYAINAKMMVPKSMLSSIFFPHALDYDLTANEEKLAVVARLLGEQIEGLPAADAATKAPDAARRILGLTSLPTRLEELDISLADLLAAADTFFSYELSSCLPRRPSSNELYDIIKAAY